MIWEVKNGLRRPTARLVLACWHGMAYWNRHGLLISAPQAVRELNALTDVPQIREDRLRSIVAEFKNTARRPM